MPTKPEPGKVTTSEPTNNAPTSESAPEPDPAPEADPSGDYKLTADYLLPEDFESDDYKLVAGGSLKNTGHVGIIVRVTARWTQLGGSPVVAKRTVRIPVHGSRHVSMTKHVGSGVIDALQAAPYDDQSMVKATIVDTFGTPTDA